jgi:hypothetical protein
VLELLVQHVVIDTPAEVANEKGSALIRIGLRLLGGIIGRLLGFLVGLPLLGRFLGLGLLLSGLGFFGLLLGLVLVRIRAVRVGVARSVLILIFILRLETSS